MNKIISNLSIYKFSFFIILLLSFATPPAIFAHMDFASREMRFILIIASLSLLFYRFCPLKKPLLLLYAAVFLFLVEMLLSVSKLSNILSYYVVIFIVLLMYYTLIVSEYKRYVYIDMWIKLGYFLSYSIVVLFFVHQFLTIDTDYFGFKGLMSYTDRNYKYSIFGVSQVKDFGVVAISRVSGYFAEPQYAGLYFFINVLIGQTQYIKHRYKKWLNINLVAGFLTFSTTFYIMVFLHYLIVSFRKIKLYDRLFLFLFLFLSVVIFYSMFSSDINIFLDSFLQKTSYSDRIIRFENGINLIVNQHSYLSVLFGHGVGYTGEFDKGISIGFLHLLVERGIVGLFFVLTMLWLFTRHNKIVYFVLILYLFVFTWYVNYIYWLGILTLWSVIKLDGKNIAYDK